MTPLSRVTIGRGAAGTICVTEYSKGQFVTPVKSGSSKSADGSLKSILYSIVPACGGMKKQSAHSPTDMSSRIVEAI